MSINFFLILLALNWEWYLLALLLSVGVTLPFVAKYTCGWFDPLRYSLLFAIFANAVPPFLLFVDQMDLSMFCYFVLSETLFWVGVFMLANKRERFSPVKINRDESFAFYIFLIAFALFVLFTLFSYAMFGIPLFLDKSRLSVYEGSGGFGILQRFNNFFNIYCLVYIYHLFATKRHKALAYSALLFISMSLILTASKAAFLNVMYSFFGYSFYYLYTVPRTKKIGLYLFIGIIASLFILIVQVQKEGGDVLSGLLAFAVRFIASGDCYVYAYPDDTYKVLETGGNSLTYFFSGFLSTIRALETIIPSLGTQLAWHVSPSTLGENIGPNSRMPLLSYVLYGWGGLILSFISGWTISFVLFRLPKYLPAGIISTAFFTYVYIMFNFNITDYPLGVNYLFDELLNFCFLFGVLFILSAFYRKKDSLALH